MIDDDDERAEIRQQFVLVAAVVARDNGEID